MSDPQKIPLQTDCAADATTSPEQCSCCQNIPPWIIGKVDTPIGIVPKVSTRLSFQDTFGSWKARWSIGRMDYKVPPRLYAVGNPDADSPVLVSANYKMSFDRLRQKLGGFNLWILVLDTKGVNVWCAAGKGTFGTRELADRIAAVKLAEVVNHRKLILPQLGAPGVSAHQVLKMSGFKVIYGPVRAKDIPAYLNAGMKITPGMREVHFSFWDRLILTPMELVMNLIPGLVILGVFFVINYIMNTTASFNHLLGGAFSNFLPFLGAGLAGSLFAPALLPFIPGRSLAWKGWLMGLLWAGIYLVLITPAANWLGVAAYLLLLPAIASFLTMNFTGATTYTSLSGVVKEMTVAVPAQIISAGLGVLLFIGTLFVKG